MKKQVHVSLYSGHFSFYDGLSAPSDGSSCVAVVCKSHLHTAFQLTYQRAQPAWPEACKFRDVTAASKLRTQKRTCAAYHGRVALKMRKSLPCQACLICLEKIRLII